MNCPGCAEGLEEQPVGSLAFLQCRACAGVLIERTSIRALSRLDPSLHPALRDRALSPGASKPKSLACPGCGKKMQSYAYGGGNTRAEACESCGPVFFERGELAAVLDEARSGIDMSEDTRTFLHAHRVRSAWERIGWAELGAISAGLFALSIFLRLGRRGPATLPIAALLGLALCGWLFVRSQRARRRESEHLASLVKAEDQRLAAREWAPLVPAAPSAQRRKSRSPAATPRACPFCAAPLPASTTHCNACDSDFG